MGAGRVGGLFGPAVGGLMLHAHLNPLATFTVAAVPMLLTAVAMLFSGKRGTEGVVEVAAPAQA